GDTVNFSVVGTIGLTTGELLITNGVTVAGPGATNLAIRGLSGRVFEIGSNATVKILGVTIRDGWVGQIGGGGIFNSGSLFLNGCLITSNSTASGTNGFSANGNGGPAGSGSAGTPAGGVFNAGTLSATACTFASNSTGAGGNGGSS